MASDRKNLGLMDIFVNQGPGSFSGLRGSISIAKGISLSKNKNLYSCLRVIKNKGYKSIAVEKISNYGLGKTINDRLYRASRY